MVHRHLAIALALSPVVVAGVADDAAGAPVSPAIVYNFDAAPPAEPGVNVPGVNVTALSLEHGELDYIENYNAPPFSGGVTYHGDWVSDPNAFVFTVEVEDGWTLKVNGWSFDGSLSGENTAFRWTIDQLAAPGETARQLADLGETTLHRFYTETFSSDDALEAVDLTGGRSYAFRLTGSGSDGTLYMDNVTIDGTAVSTPEPGSIALLGISALMMWPRRGPRRSAG